MDNGLASTNLTTIEPSDYVVCQELYEMVMNGLIDKVVKSGMDFWNIECNEIRNDSNLFNLMSFFEKSQYNTVRREDFEDKYDYEIEVNNSFKNIILNDLINRLKQIKVNDNIENFLNEANKRLNKSGKKIK